MAWVPMANGKPAPMTPKLPLEMKVRGLSLNGATNTSSLRPTLATSKLQELQYSFSYLSVSGCLSRLLKYNVVERVRSLSKRSFGPTRSWNGYEFARGGLC